MKNTNNLIQLVKKTKIQEKRSYGFTLVELMVSMIVLVIASFTIGAVIVDGQNGWSRMYNKINADVVTDGYVVSKKFDAVIRKASSNKIFIGEDNKSIEVYYYSSTLSSSVDMYASFYESDGDLIFEYGQISPKTTKGYEKLCSNVSSCTFNRVGQAAQMILVLDNGSQKNTVITSAYTNN